jgi:hypothetical protein
MKQVLFSIAIVALWCTTMSSGCDSGGSSGGGGSFNGGQVTVVPSGGGVSKQGSAARFTIYKNCLYTLHNDSVYTWEIFPNGLIAKRGGIRVHHGIEALFVFRDQLFVASNVGVTYYTIDNPFVPKYLSGVTHITGCDPVVSNGTHMYYTVHGGTDCRNNAINSLYCYQLNANGSATFLSEMSFKKPIGLGINGQYLYVCDNGVGLRVIDISTPNTIKLLKTVAQPQAVDIIVDQDLLIMRLENGISYYDISEKDNPTFLSTVLN